VYSALNPAALRGQREVLLQDQARPRIARTVFLLGLTSLFTDISSEMVVTVLPLYLVAVGGFSPLAFGVIDGIYNGATAVIRLAAGYVGDRRQRHKPVAAVGYGLSAVCKLLLVLVGTAVSAVGAVVFVDRIGKGIRTAPRDAMISLATPKAELGTAFGVHRAMDTVGAMLGPLLAFALLAAAPLAFNTVFVVSFCLALVGLGVLVLFVQPREDAPRGEAPAKPATLRGAAALWRVPRFRALALAGIALSLATASDAFIFLALQDEVDLGTSMFPLLFVGSAGAYMALAVPLGRLADRIGRGRVFLGGYALLFAVYALLVAPVGGGWGLVVGALALLGAYYAATDGVLMALGSTVVPDEIRGTGLALLGTATSVARLVASIAFGALWTVWGIDTALAAFGIALVAACAFAAVALHRTPEPAHA
jgi:MFS family permease